MTTGPVVGLGEILWDLLPGGPQPGGAPFNFAFHCHQLGHEAVIVSRVGDDELGRRLLGEVRARGLSDAYIQVDPTHPTGTVRVAVDADGQPAYTIVEGVSYDFLEWTPALEALASTARAVCFGTLAQRGEKSRATIRSFLQRIRQRTGHSVESGGSAVTVFDINLRQHFYTRDVIESSLALSDWLKLNADELVTLGAMLPVEAASDSEALERLASAAGRCLDLVCLTRGEHGCLIRGRLGQAEHRGIRVEVADTVGAGDAFTAGLLTQVLEGKSVAEAARFATRFAALVASRPGGTPRITGADWEMLHATAER